MNIRTIDVQGFEAAITAMRHPMESYHLSDSEKVFRNDGVNLPFYVGERDKELSIKLQQAGPEHCKHLRMIYVWAEITGPRYWWNEFDTYRFGVDKVSCSTMHKLMARELTLEDFEIDDPSSLNFRNYIQYLNDMMNQYKSEENPEKKKATWRHIIQCLPQSYLQKRTVCMSYAALRNIVRQREGHKLKEWQWFIDWARKLPKSWMIFK